MDESMNITQDELLDRENLDEAEDDVFSAEIEDDGEDGYELTDEEIMELADEEDVEEDEESFEQESDEVDGEDAETSEQDEVDEPPAEGEDASKEGEGASGEGEGTGDQNAADPSAAAPVDYGTMAKQDLEAITRAFPGIGITDLRQIDNAGRYGALREMGLTPEEAFRATNGNRISAHAAATARARADGKSHIRGDMPQRQGGAEGFSLSATQLRDYREIFPDKSDKEITELVRSVSKKK